MFGFVVLVEVVAVVQVVRMCWFVEIVVVAVVELVGFVIELVLVEDFQLEVRVVWQKFGLMLGMVNFAMEDFDLIQLLLECQIAVENFELALHFVDEALQF